MKLALPKSLLLCSELSSMTFLLSLESTASGMSSFHAFKIFFHQFWLRKETFFFEELKILPLGYFCVFLR